MGRPVAVALAVASLAALVACGQAPLGTVPCPGAQARCGGACVDEATDRGNCGGCGLTCDACTNGHCVVVLASGQNNPGPIAVTSTEVVWANQGVTGSSSSVGAAIMKAPLGGGPVETLATNEIDATALAIDSGDAYWTTDNLSFPSNGQAAVPNGTIVKMSLQGGAASVLASNQMVGSSVAVHEGTLYWPSFGGLMSVSTSGGTPTVVSPGVIVAMTLSAGTIYWAEQDDTSSNVLKKKALSAAAPEITLNETSDFGAILRLAVSSTDLYWTVEDPVSGFVKKVSLGGGAASTVYSASDDIIDYAIAVDGDSVYWGQRTNGDQLDGHILKAPLAGGSPVTFAPGALETRYMVIDATSVYFTDLLKGEVIKVTPK